MDKNEIIDKLHEGMLDLCNGHDAHVVATCASLLMVQALLMMGLSKERARIAVTDFVDDIYPEEGTIDGYRTLQ